MRYHIKKYQLIPIFCLFGVVIFLYFPIFFLGKSLQAPSLAQMDFNLKSPPSINKMLSGEVNPQIFNTEQATAAYNFYPQDIYTGKIYRSGQIPLWNSHNGAGTQYLYENGVFFPLRILESFFAPTGNNLFFMLNIWLAGIGAYFFLKNTGMETLIAFFGGSLYMGSGVFSWFLQMEPYVAVSVVLPYIMLTTNMLTNKITPANIASHAIASAMMLYAGHPEAAFFGFVLSGCYGCYKVFQEKTSLKRKANVLMFYIISTTIGFMLASPQILLFYQTYKSAISIHSASLIDNPTISGTFFILLPAIILPKLLGWPIMPLAFADAGSWDFLGSYIGVVSLFFIIMGCYSERSREKMLFLFFLSFGIAFLMLDLRIWPISLVNYLPFFNKAWSPRWGGSSWSFALICAASYGFHWMQSIYKMNILTRKKLIRKLIYPMGILLYLCILPAAHSGIISGPYTFPVSTVEFRQVINAILSIIFSVIVISFLSYLLLNEENSKKTTITCILLQIVSLWYWIPKGSDTFTILQSFPWKYNYIMTQCIELFIALGFLIAIFLWYKNLMKFCCILLICVFSSYILFYDHAKPGYPNYQRADATTPFIHFLQKNAKNDRIFALDGILSPTYSTIYGLYDIRYILELAPKTTVDFYNNYIQSMKSPHLYGWFNSAFLLSRSTDLHKPAVVEYQNDILKSFNVLSVKYIITNHFQDIMWMKKFYPHWVHNLIPIYQDNNVNIYQNKSAYPRVFFVSQYQETKSFEEAQSIAMKPDFKLKNEATLEKKAPYAPIDTNQLNAQAIITKYADNKVQINTTSNHPSLLVLTDMYFPGWKAKIDTTNTEIYRVNGLLRGVFVPKGNHIVTYYYFPTIFIIGLYTMFLAILIIISLYVISYAKKRQLQRT